WGSAARAARAPARPPRRAAAPERPASGDAAGRTSLQRWPAARIAATAAPHSTTEALPTAGAVHHPDRAPGTEAQTVPSRALAPAPFDLPARQGRPGHDGGTARSGGTRPKV